MKLTKTFRITVRGKTKKECEQFFEQIQQFCDSEWAQMTMLTILEGRFYLFSSDEVCKRGSDG